MFYLFKTPNDWASWLVAAIEAEKICVKNGMTNQEAREYLLKQEPGKVYEFSQYFDKPKSSNSRDVTYSQNTNYNEGSRYVFPYKGCE